MNLVINPPPRDRCCERCGKNIKDLKSFGKAGDPLVGNFEGVLLLKGYRTIGKGTENECVGACWECRDCFIKED